MGNQRPTGKDRLLVALDVPSLFEARAIAEELRNEVGGFKVGLELLTSEGSRTVVTALANLGCRLFYDGKFNDIPNTVAGATAALRRQGVWMFNVHGSSGLEALRSCAASKGDALGIVVTVLTSLNERDAESVFGSVLVPKVLQFSRWAVEAGMDGVVCSAQELEFIRNCKETRDLLAVVPGIRPAWASVGDQARVMSPSEAVGLGADYLVVGRPVVKPPDTVANRTAAARLIVEEIEQAEKGFIV